jgi:hypothetical protein
MKLPYNQLIHPEVCGHQGFPNHVVITYLITIIITEFQLSRNFV